MPLTCSLLPGGRHPDVPEGEYVRIVGVDLRRIKTGYMLFWPADGYGTRYGSYKASSYSGANFRIDTNRTSKQYITVSVTSTNANVTDCRDTDYV